MTHIETTRVNDLIALQIGSIQKAAQQLNVDSELQKLETTLSSLEMESNALRQTLNAIPHNPAGRATENKALRGAPRPEHKVSHEIFPHVTGEEDDLS